MEAERVIGLLWRGPGQADGLAYSVRRHYICCSMSQSVLGLLLSLQAAHTPHCFTPIFLEYGIGNLC